jgi:hypothetical protein
MSDFLGRLAARAQGEAAVVKPRVRSRYEGGEAGPPPASGGWGEEEVVEAAGRKEQARDGRAPEAPVERRMVTSPEPAPKAVEPRQTRLPEREVMVERPLEAAARPAPSPALVEERRRPAKAGGDTVVAPEAPAPRRSGLRLPPPEPDPRPERRAEEPEPAAPSPPEARRAVRTSRPQPVEPRSAPPLPIVGPRRGIPDPAPTPAQTAGDAAEEVVRVSIGRIDVHAGPPPVQAPAPRRSGAPRLALSDYLAGRNERRRR